MIDVLRWSSVVVTALANGAEWVEAFESPSDAAARATQLGRAQAVLGGERGNVALPGFDLGNSPCEYTAERVGQRGVITTTTNGTQAITAARDASELYVGAFLNLDALVRLLKGRVGPLTLICAGQAGVEAVEDSACAGAIAEALGDPGSDPGGDPGTDPGTAHAMRTWQAAGRDPTRALTMAPHGMALAAAGFQADLTFAASRSRFDLVPAREPAGSGTISSLVARFPNAARIVSDMHPRPPETDDAEAAPGRPAPP